MEKVTKKDLARKLQHQESRIDRLVEKLARKGFYDDEQEQADHDEVLIILDRKEPKLKVLDQSVFDGLPSEYKWVARDRNGSRYAYAEKPRPREFDGVWVHTGGKHARYVDNSYDDAGWQNSLIERKELTGSDLCRAMLARGDTRIMCKVYDVDRKHDITHVIRAYRDGKFHTKANRWDNAIPINNQGEPLTQSDVGL